MTDRSEQHKWDHYYRELASSTEIHAGARIVYEEVAQALRPLMSAGARALEAGCGAGFQSLFLARLGWQVSLLDFSEEALSVARGVFQRFEQPARFETGDITAGAGEADHDLVFNSGVLEHYSFEDQVRLVRGMARRSRRHVLVLVPNRHCHWYWIWRAQQAVAGQWPFGYEKPASDYRPVFEAAGLNCLGRAWFATGAIGHFLQGVQGLDDPLRALLVRMNTLPIFPVEQRAYLVGFLASVRTDATAVAGFADQDDTDADASDARAAQALDTLVSDLRRGPPAA